MNLEHFNGTFIDPLPGIAPSVDYDYYLQCINEWARDIFEKLTEGQKIAFLICFNQIDRMRRYEFEELTGIDPHNGGEE